MRNARLALIYWTRSSKQANIDILMHPTQIPIALCTVMGFSGIMVTS
jgi:hypothetical protein